MAILLRIQPINKRTYFNRDMKTAVQWLIEQVEGLNINDDTVWNEVQIQALEMEKNAVDKAFRLQTMWFAIGFLSTALVDLIIGLINGSCNIC